MFSRLLFVFCVLCSLQTSCLAEIAKDLYGDPLPEGAVARLGTVRYRHPGWYKRIDFLADNETIVIGTRDNTIRFWNARSGKQVRSVDVDPMRIQAFSVSPNGKSVVILKSFLLQASREYNTQLLIEDAATGAQHSKARWMDSMLEAGVVVDASPKGKVAAVGTRSGKVRIIDVATGKELKSIEPFRGEVTSVTFSPAGDAVAITGRRGRMRLAVAN